MGKKGKNKDNKSTRNIKNWNSQTHLSGHEHIAAQGYNQRYPLAPTGINTGVRQHGVTEVDKELIFEFFPPTPRFPEWDQTIATIENNFLVTKVAESRDKATCGPYKDQSYPVIFKDLRVHKEILYICNSNKVGTNEVAWFYLMQKINSMLPQWVIYDYLLVGQEVSGATVDLDGKDTKRMLEYLQTTFPDKFCDNIHENIGHGHKHPGGGAVTNPSTTDNTQQTTVGQLGHQCPVRYFDIYTHTDQGWAGVYQYEPFLQKFENPHLGLWFREGSLDSISEKRKEQIDEQLDELIRDKWGHKTSQHKGYVHTRPYQTIDRRSSTTLGKVETEFSRRIVGKQEQVAELENMYDNEDFWGQSERDMLRTSVIGDDMMGVNDFLFELERALFESGRLIDITDQNFIDVMQIEIQQKMQNVFKRLVTYDNTSVPYTLTDLCEQLAIMLFMKNMIADDDITILINTIYEVVEVIDKVHSSTTLDLVSVLTRKHATAIENNEDLETQLWQFVKDLSDSHTDNYDVTALYNIHDIGDILLKEEIAEFLEKEEEGEKSTLPTDNSPPLEEEIEAHKEGKNLNEGSNKTKENQEKIAAAKAAKGKTIEH